jgi:hypothetical protein
MQYVETISLANENRYIIADIDRRQFNTDIRINLNITSDLTIQYWAQPFVFAGEYSSFKRISKPMAEGYGDRFIEYTRNEIFYDTESAVYNVDENQDGTTDFSFENPDFSFFEFRSNLVLRWEYVPGSTVYLVWSQGRSGDSNSGNFNMKDDINTLYSIVPHNVFMLKFSYRLSI